MENTRDSCAVREKNMNTMRLWPGGPLYAEAKHMPITTDSILLADFAVLHSGEKGADLGCASGLLMLMLLWREKGLRMTGLELLPEAVQLAEENLRANGLQERAELVYGDLRETARKLPNGGFDFIISNPPYYTTESGSQSPDEARSGARGEKTLRLPELCRAASQLCRSGGRVFFCYRAERLVSLLQEMREQHLEPKRIRFVHHNAASPASLLLVEGRKDGKPGLKAEPAFLIRGEDGKETEEYRRICHQV